MKSAPVLSLSGAQSMHLFAGLNGDLFLDRQLF